MLVLTRKRSEMIQIGEDVFVKVIRTGKSTVKIGIEAPANVRVIRGELKVEPRPPIAGTVAGAVEAHDAFYDEHAEVVANCSDQFPHPHIV